jgi:hypothetical protein
MRDWGSMTEVQEWVDESGVELLREHVDVPRFQGQNLTLARAWLSAHDRRLAEAARLAQDAMLERSTVATETAAKAAESAAIVAWCALGVAAAGLVVAFLTYIGARA